MRPGFAPDRDADLGVTRDAMPGPESGLGTSVPGRDGDRERGPRRAGSKIDSGYAEPLASAEGRKVTDPALRGARVGVTLLFLTNGLVWANLVPRYPEIRDSIGLSYGQFGIAVACGPAGALIFGLTAGMLIRRFTSRAVAIVTTILMAFATIGAAAAPSFWTFAAALFAMGACDAVTDVAQNSHGLRVQRLTGRSMLNSFHATWSVGAVLGGIMGGLAAGLHIDVPVHLAIMTAVVIAVLVVAWRMLLKGPEPVDAEAHGSASGLRSIPLRTWGVLLALGFIAIAGVWVEDAGASWSASYLRDSLGTGATVAAMGFVALMAMHFVGRIIGDGLVDRFGQRAVARVGGAVTAIGMGAALLFPSVPLTIIGFGLAGLGVATTVPAAMHGADELPGFRPGTALTISSWMLRVGFLVGPPVVGAVADAASLRAGLLVVPVAGVAIIVLAGVLSTERVRTPQE
jgi:MFS family permease